MNNEIDHLNLIIILTCTSYMYIYILNLNTKKRRRIFIHILEKWEIKPLSHCYLIFSGVQVIDRLLVRGLVRPHWKRCKHSACHHGHHLILCLQNTGFLILGITGWDERQRMDGWKKEKHLLISLWIIHTLLIF